MEGLVSGAISPLLDAKKRKIGGRHPATAVRL